MDRRLNPWTAAPQAVAAMAHLAETLHACLPSLLRSLVELRASQINGCAFCCAMHAREARAAGATEEQLDCLAGWPEARCFDERTRAALAWTEAVTLVRETRAPRDAYELASRHFTEPELAALTIVAAAINAWNRIGVSLRLAPFTRPRP